MSKHTGPYTVKFLTTRGKEISISRKTFKAAENVAGGYFRREVLNSVQIVNEKGLVHSVYNFQRAGLVA